MTDMKSGISRRSFLKTSVAAAGATAIAGSGIALAADGKAVSSQDEIFYSVCRGNCGSRCPQKVVVREGKVVSTSAALMATDADNADERRICVKGLTQPQRMYDSDRVKYPMRRVEGTERGAGQWERISWDDAMTEVASKMKATVDKYGWSSVAFWNSYASTGLINGSGTGAVAYGRFLTRTGATILGPGADWAQMFYAYGSGGTSMFFGNAGLDVPNAGVVICWGANPTDAYPQDWQFICRAQEAGKKLITIDPRYTAIAAHSDWYLAPIPGTDGALMLAMANYIMDNGLVNEQFAKFNTQGPLLMKADGTHLRLSDIPAPAAAEGEEEVAEESVPAPAGDPIMVWDEVAGMAVPMDTTATPALYGTFNVNGVTVKTTLTYVREKIAEFTPAKAAEITDIAEADIIKLATIYATEGPVFIHTNQGLGHHVNSPQNYRNLLLLASLTGSIGCSGGSLGHASLGYRSFPYDGSYFAAGPGGNISICGMYLPELVRDKKFGATPVDIHFLWIANGNPLCCESGRPELIEAVKTMDFIVCADCSMTDSADYADIILPIPHVYEVEDIAGMPFVPYFPFQPKMIDPLYECRSDFDILVDLSKRLGMADLYDRTAEEYLKNILETPANVAAGVTYDRLHKELVRLYDTSAVPIVDTSAYFTATGKVTYFVEHPVVRMNYGQVLEEFQQRPAYVHANESYKENPDCSKYPLFGLSQHEKYHVHSQMSRTPWMREIEPEPFIRLNTKDAAARGVAQGDYVRVYNDHGYAVLKACVTAGIKEGVITIPHGWHNSQFVEGNTQDLTNRYMDPLCANSAFNDFICEVEKYEGSVK